MIYGEIFARGHRLFGTESVFLAPNIAHFFALATIWPYLIT